MFLVCLRTAGGKTGLLCASSGFFCLNRDAPRDQVSTALMKLVIKDISEQLAKLLSSRTALSVQGSIFDQLEHLHSFLKVNYFLPCAFYFILKDADIIFSFFKNEIFP